MCPKIGATAGIPAESTVTAGIPVGITAQYPISIPAGIPVGVFNQGRYLSYMINFSSRQTLSKVITREAKTCNFIKTLQKRSTSRSSTFQCH